MEKSLAFLAGIGGPSIKEYINIRVDNGDDKVGTNATGEFVNKEGRKGNFVRTSYGKELEVIVLIQKAQISKSITQGGIKTQEWWSDEFNPLNSDELITIHSGKDKKVIVGKFTYSQIQQKFPKIQGESGQMKNPFNYQTVLYLKDVANDNIYRMPIAGGIMRKWIEFKSSFPVNLWMTTIFMNVAFDETAKTYTLELKPGKEVVRSYVEGIVASIMSSMKVPEIAAPTQNVQIEQPSPKDELPVIQQEEDNVNAMIDEENEKVDINSIPF